jgi:multidrug efflux pump subunit AcrB
VFLVMAVLFESFVLPLVIMISVPVAAAGGVAGLAVLNLYQAQPLDMLTLLGFVILVGIVVNNAILLWRTSRSITSARRAWACRRRFWRPPATASVRSSCRR